MTSIEEIGEAQGRETGRTEERREPVLCLLDPLTLELRERVAALPSEALLALSDALLDFNNDAELIAWLDQQQAEAENG